MKNSFFFLFVGVSLILPFQLQATATFTSTSYVNDFVGSTVNGNGQAWNQNGTWGSNTIAYAQSNNELDISITQSSWIYAENAFTTPIDISSNKLLSFSTKGTTAGYYLLVQLFDASTNSGTQAQAIFPLNASYNTYSLDFSTITTNNFNYAAIKGIRFWVLSNAQGSNYATLNGFHLFVNNISLGTGTTNTNNSAIDRWTGDAQNINIYNTNSGNVSIGTNPSLEPTLSTPYYKFTIAGRTNIIGDANALEIWSPLTQSSGFRHYMTFGIGTFSNSTEYGVIGTNEYKTSSGVANPKHLLLQTNSTNGGGNVGIGAFSLAPTSKLCVNPGTNIKAFTVVNSSGVDVFKVTNTGTVYATEMKVRLTPFPDYVFDSTYQLMPLDSVSAFITSQGHLPNMPSAEEVDSSEVGIGEMTRLQQEKIEEITLYLLQMDARMKELEEQNKILAQKILDAENKKK